METLVEKIEKIIEREDKDSAPVGKTFQVAVRDDGKTWTYTVKGPGVSKSGTGKNLHQAMAYAASAIVRG